MIPWENLTAISEIEDILQKSNERPCIIFKHSTRCGISLHVKHDLESKWDLNEKDVHVFYLDLLSFREVSNYVAESLKVTHQSPQIIILKDEKVVFHTSHRAIDYAQIKKYILD